MARSKFNKGRGPRHTPQICYPPYDPPPIGPDDPNWPRGLVRYIQLELIGNMLAIAGIPGNCDLADDVWQWTGTEWIPIKQDCEPGSQCWNDGWMPAGPPTTPGTTPGEEINLGCKPKPESQTAAPVPLILRTYAEFVRNQTGAQYNAIGGRDNVPAFNATAQLPPQTDENADWPLTIEMTAYSTQLGTTHFAINDLAPFANNNNAPTTYDQTWDLSGIASTDNNWQLASTTVGISTTQLFQLAKKHT
jgi:hypothetical protein